MLEFKLGYHSVFVCLCMPLCMLLCVVICPWVRVCVCAKARTACNSGCPFKGPSQICPRHFDQAFYDSLALGGSQDGRVCAGWEVVDVGDCGFDPQAQTHRNISASSHTHFKIWQWSFFQKISIKTVVFDLWCQNVITKLESSLNKSASAAFF